MRQRGSPPRRAMLRAVGCLLALGWMNVLAATTLSLGSPGAGPGEFAGVAVQFQSDASPVALQFDVHFDAARLTPGYAVADQAGTGFLIRSGSSRPGVVRVLVYSDSNRPMVNGTLVTLPLRVVPSALGGGTPLTISNVVLSSSSGTRLEPVTAVGGSVTIRNETSPVFQRPTVSANGQWVLTLNGQDGRSYTLQASTDLATWQPLATVVATGGVAVFNDAPAAGRTHRYYRAVLAP